MVMRGQKLSRNDTQPVVERTAQHAGQHQLELVGERLRPQPPVEEQEHHHPRHQETDGEDAHGRHPAVHEYLRGSEGGTPHGGDAHGQYVVRPVASGETLPVHAL